MTSTEARALGLERWDRDKVYFTGSDVSRTRTIWVGGAFKYYCELKKDGQTQLVEVLECGNGYRTKDEI